MRQLDWVECAVFGAGQGATTRNGATQQRDAGAMKRGAGIPSAENCSEAPLDQLTPAKTIALVSHPDPVYFTV